MNLTLTCPADACYTNQQCDIDYKGRVISAALVKKTVSDALDKTDATAFLDSLFLEALLGNAILFLKIAGDKPKPETAELPGTGTRISRPGAKTHTVNFTDAQVVGNVGFYNKILRNSQNYDFFYFTPNLVWDASGTQVTMIGDPVIENDLTKFINGETMVKWVADNNPEPDDFDTATLLQGLFYEISGPSTIDVTVGGGTTAYTADLNYSFGSTSLPDLVWSLTSSASVIAALGAEINSITGELDLSAPTVGEYILSITVSNEYGCIFGTLEVTVTVTA